MATRFYTDDATAPSVSPSYIGSWGGTSYGARRKISLTRQDTGYADRNAFDPGSAAGTELLYQFVSDPMSAATILSSATVEACFQCWEASNFANAYLRMAFGKCAGDGSGATFWEASDDNTEFDTVLATPYSRYHSHTVGTQRSLSSGERLIVEIGINFDNTKSTAYEGFIRNRNNSATDLTKADDVSSDYNSWIEFSTDMTESGPVTKTPPVVSATLGQLAGKLGFGLFPPVAVDP